MDLCKKKDTAFNSGHNRWSLKFECIVTIPWYYHRFYKISKLQVQQAAVSIVPVQFIHQSVYLFLKFGPVASFVQYVAYSFSDCFPYSTYMEKVVMNIDLQIIYM